MKHTQLELVGYKRMQLNQINRFVFQPTEQIQLILGTNGSGKSSLMGELSPLPGDASDFTKEGSKDIRITNKGNTYHLSSKFSPKTHHSFVMNSEELNLQGTVTVQNTLVKQHFGITPAIHDMLIGRRHFCSMSAPERREWFTRLSDISYDYALSVYQKLKDRARDTSGALKLNKKRLVTEQSKIISEAEETRLLKEVEEITQELTLLQSQAAPLTRPVHEYEDDLHTGLEQLSKLSMQLLRTRYVAPYGQNPLWSERRDDWGELQRPDFQSIADITKVVDEYRQTVQTREALINKAIEDHGKIKETVRVLTRAGEDGVRALATKQEALREKRDAILRKRKLGIEGSDAANALSALDSVRELLQDVFTAIPENEDRKYSSERLKELGSEALKVKDRRTKKTSDLNFLSSQRQHLEVHRNGGDLTCPKCSHRWSGEYSEAKYQTLLEKIATEEDLARAIDAEAEALEKEATANREYGEFYRDYVRTTRNWPVLSLLWEHLQSEGYVTRAPRKVLSVVDTYRADLVLEAEAKAVETRLAELAELIRQAATVGDANLAEQTERLAELTLQIETLTAERTVAQQRVNDYSHYRKQLTEAEALGAKILALQTSLTQTNADMVEMVRRETLNHCITQLRHTLVRKEETLSTHKLQKGIVQELEAAIARLNVEEEAAKALTKALSPSEGLIAEGLLGFIRNFTNQMNGLIRKIWTYPLQLQDCGVASETRAELDYKFPLIVQTKSNVVPDISKGSRGQQEIINLAFRIISMRYLGLSESPLFLDEFAQSFDPEHRSSASLAIKNLLEQYSFTQLFMVSHDYHQYGSLGQLEVCVLDARNIVTPEVYNQHVTIS